VPAVANLIACLALLVLPLAFDLRCAEPVQTVKLSVWVLAAAVAAGFGVFRPRGAAGFLALWTGWLLLSTLLNRCWGGSAAAFVLLCGLLCLPWFRGNPEHAFRWAGGGWLLTVAYSWMQRLGLDPMPWSNPELSQSMTIAGLGNPNYLGMYLAALLPLVWWRAYRAAWPAWLLVLAGWSTLVLTATRGSVLATTVVLLSATVVGAWKRGPSRQFWLATWALFIGGLVIGAVFPKNHLKAEVLVPGAQPSAVGAYNVQARLLMWRVALPLGLSHPLLGVGPGHFGVHYLQQRPLEWEVTRVRQRLPEDPHNEPLRVWSETGVVGFALWVAWTIALLRGLWRRYPAAAAGCAVLLLNGMTNSYPVAVWPLLIWWTALAVPGEVQPPTRVRWLGLPLALGLACLAFGTWHTQRQFWWAPVRLLLLRGRRARPAACARWRPWSSCAHLFTVRSWRGGSVWRTWIWN
jgi:O-antigen ligase